MTGQDRSSNVASVIFGSLMMFLGLAFLVLWRLSVWLAPMDPSHEGPPSFRDMWQVGDPEYRVRALIGKARLAEGAKALKLAVEPIPVGHAVTQYASEVEIDGCYGLEDWPREGSFSPRYVFKDLDDARPVLEATLARLTAEGWTADEGYTAQPDEEEWTVSKDGAWMTMVATSHGGILDIQGGVECVHLDGKFD